MANLLLRLLGDPIEELMQGDWKGAAGDMRENVKVLLTPGTYQFWAYTIPAVGVPVAGRIATSMGANPGFTVGRGKKKTRVVVF